MEVARGDVIVVAALADTAKALPFAPALARPLDAPEALAVKKTSLGGKPAVLVAGADARGLMYSLLDAAERVAVAGDPADLLGAIREIEERPTVRDRALSVYTMNRGYWESRFYNEDYWTRYFDTLAASRFNRFLIIFGYENGGFLAPPYPYFFDTPGFPGVRMVGLTPEQQRRNLAALNRLIELAQRARHHRDARHLGSHLSRRRAGRRRGVGQGMDPNPESLDVKYWNDQTFLRLMKARQGLKGGEACYYKPLRDMQW